MSDRLGPGENLEDRHKRTSLAGSRLRRLMDHHQISKYQMHIVAGYRNESSFDHAYRGLKTMSDKALTRIINRYEIGPDGPLTIEYLKGEDPDPNPK